MNQGHLEEERLHRYFDGDLRGGEAAAVAEHLASCDECSARHRTLSSLRSMLELAAAESARGVDFDAAYARIARGVREPRPVGLGERLSLWWRDLAEQRPSRLYVPLAGTLAAAAALLVVVLRGEPAPSPPQARQAPAVEDAPEEQLARPAPPRREKVMLASASSEVEQVDFGDNAGTVFEIALADGVSTPVVWINDEP